MRQVCGVFRGTPRFRLIGPLGAGGMGAVFEAVDREDGSRVALKVLPNCHPASVIAFKVEFRSLRGIHHPNLATMGELIEHDGQLFFTMELVRGVDLLSYVRSPRPGGRHVSGTFRGGAAVDEPTARKGGPPPRARSPDANPGRPDELRLRDAFRQVALALGVLHGAGKLHRDVKPSNVLVTPEGRAVLLDFGLVVDVARPTGAPDTALGSVSYMSPEQAQGRPVTFSSDWYSYGAMLFEALTGHPPFVGTVREILALKEAKDGDAPSRHAAAVPRDLDGMCEALLRRCPTLRPRGEDVLALLSPGEARGDRSGDSAPVFAPFVGRARELRELQNALVHADDKPIVVTLEGESGVGKTALALRFLSAVRDESKGGALVAYGRCSERERIPFKAFDEIASQIANVIADKGILSPGIDTPAFRAAIRGASVIFPALSEAAQTHPTDGSLLLDSVARRATAFRGVRAVIGILARQSRVVLCIDDWQWADADSVALLSEILARDGPRALVVLLSRDGTPAIARVDQRLQLRNLGAAEAEQLAGQWLESEGLAPDAVHEAAVSIATESTGHPLFILELVQQVVTRGHDAKRPPRLDDALWGRYCALDPAAKNAAQALATARAPTSLLVLCDAVAHLGTPLAWFERPGLMDGLRLERFARFDGLGSSDKVDCFHDRVAAAILSGLTPEEKQRCHHALALALEKSATLDLETLAAHWLGAGEPRRATERAEGAGDRAMQGLAFQRAAKLYRLCLRLLSDRGGASGIRAKLGEALSHLGDSSEAARQYVAAAATAPDERRIALQQLAADQLFRSGDFEEAVSLSERVFASLGMAWPSRRWATWLLLLAQRVLLRLRGIGFQRRVASTLSRAALARVDAGWSVAIGLGMVDNFRGSYVQSRHLRMALDLGEPYRVLRAMAIEVSYRATEGSRSRPALERWTAQAEGLAREIGDPYAFGFTHLTRGIGSFLCGDWAAATRACESAESIFENRPSMAAWELATSRLFLLFSHFYLGDLASLRSRVPELVREATSRGDVVAAMNLRLSVCNTAWLVEDDPKQAARQLDEAERSCPTQGGYVPQYWCTIARANLCLYEGHAEEAHRRVTAMWPMLRRSMLMRTEFVRIESHWLRGRCALARAAADARSRTRLLGEARDCGRRLAREQAPWAQVLALLLRAAIGAMRKTTQSAAELQAVALTEAARAHLGLMALVAGSTIPAPDGRGAAHRIEDIVARPERWRGMLLPGL